MRKEMEELGSDISLVASVSVDDTNLNGEFVKLSSAYAYYSAEYADAVDKEAKAKFLVKKTYAERYLFLREDLQNAGVKVTEAILDSHVQIDTLYQQAYMLHIEAQTNKTEVWGILEALKVKRDSLITIGANMRAERDSSISLNNRIDDEEASWTKD